MRPPHEIKRGQRGAKPGVPRKSRSTDDETEEAEAMEAMESDESELEAAAAVAAALNRPPVITEYQRNNFGVNTNSPDNQPMDLANYDRINSLPVSAVNNCVKAEATSPRSRSLSPGAKPKDVTSQSCIKPKRPWDAMLSRPLTGKID